MARDLLLGLILTELGWDPRYTRNPREQLYKIERSPTLVKDVKRLVAAWDDPDTAKLPWRKMIAEVGVPEMREFVETRLGKAS